MNKKCIIFRVRIRVRKFVSIVIVQRENWFVNNRIVHNSIVQILISTLIIPFVLFDIILFALSIDYSFVYNFKSNFFFYKYPQSRNTFLRHERDFCIILSEISNTLEEVKIIQNLSFLLEFLEKSSCISLEVPISTIQGECKKRVSRDLT